MEQKEMLNLLQQGSIYAKEQRKNALSVIEAEEELAYWTGYANALFWVRKEVFGEL